MFAFHVSGAEPLLRTVNLMKRALRHSIFWLWLSVFSGHAASDGYYKLFLSLGPTNETSMPYGGEEVPLVTDTNNIAPKLTKSKLSELTVGPQPAVAGVQLGMKMDQVVAAWGKPREVSVYHGAPRLLYQDSHDAYDVYAHTYVFFSPGSNSVMAVWVFFSNNAGQPRLSPKVQECLRVLGEPVARNYIPDPFEPRKTPPKHWYCRMVYKQPPLLLYFADGRLMAYELNPRAKGVAPEGQGTDDFSVSFCLE